MARKASVRYWPGRKGGGYYCVHQGIRHELALGPNDAPDGPTYLAALEQFKQVMQKDQQATPTVRVILETYLQHISTKKKAGTVELRLRAFTPFVNYQPGDVAHGERPCSSGRRDLNRT